MRVYRTIHASGVVQAMTTDPNEVISLRNSRGVQADIIPIGATIQRLLVPDINGKAEDIVLGYDDPQSYRVSAVRLP